MGLDDLIDMGISQVRGLALKAEQALEESGVTPHELGALAIGALASAVVVAVVAASAPETSAPVAPPTPRRRALPPASEPEGDDEYAHIPTHHERMRVMAERAIVTPPAPALPRVPKTRARKG